MPELSPSAIADRCREVLSDGGRLVVSTGAGMSRESGIPTFRGEEGVWRQHRAEDVATPQALRNHPRLFWEFNDHLRQLCAGAAPNAGHEALGRLQQTLDLPVSIVTQNIDRLHERGGAREVIHLHGDVLRVICPRCGFADDGYPVPAPELPPICECGSVLRPDIVLFGEMLPEKAVSEAFDLAHQCDVMWVVGTSVSVQPAASLPFVALEAGAVVIEVNPEPTILTRDAHLSIRDTAARLLPPIVEALLTPEASSGP